ncbi:unnamed protein product [Sympodiomycopsis kandeliae]
MSLLNAVLKISITTLNLLDIYKALTYKNKKTRNDFKDLGKPKITILETSSSSSSSSRLRYKHRIGSSSRRQELKKALSLSLIWILFQSLENNSWIESILQLMIPFYSSLKTCFLFWVFIARSNATMKLTGNVLRPIIHPYERMIDTVLMVAIGIALNAIFLASLPISHARVYIKQWIRHLGNAMSNAFSRESVAIPDTSKTKNLSQSPRQRTLVPPPSNRKRKSSTPGSGNGSLPSAEPTRAPANNHLRLPSTLPPGIRKHRSASSLSTAPSTTSVRKPSANSQSAGRSVSGGVKPHAVSSSISSTTRIPARIPSASLASATPRIASQSLSSTTPRNVSESLSALNDLPRPPQGFTPGASGGFAFIPPAISTPSKSSSATNGMFSPIVPGAFSMHVQTTPSSSSSSPKMPAKAKAKASPSKSNGKITSSTQSQRSKFVPVRRSRRVAQKDMSEAEGDGDTDVDTEMNDAGSNDDHPTTKVTPAKRSGDAQAVAQSNSTGKKDPASATRTTRIRTTSLPMHKKAKVNDEKEAAPAVERAVTRRTARSRTNSTVADAVHDDDIVGRASRSRPPVSQAARRAATATNTGSGSGRGRGRGRGRGK